MKKIVILIAAVLLSTTCFAATPQESLESMVSVMKKMTIISGAIIAGGNQVVHMSVDTLQRKGTYSEYRTFYYGTTYKITGIGSDGISDLDIVIIDANGNEVVKDTKADNLPDVTFTPTSTGTYTIKVLAYSTSDLAASQENFFGIVISYVK